MPVFITCTLHGYSTQQFFCVIEAFLKSAMCIILYLDTYSYQYAKLLALLVAAIGGQLKDGLLNCMHVHSNNK